MPNVNYTHGKTQESPSPKCLLPGPREKACCQSDARWWCPCCRCFCGSPCSSWFWVTIRAHWARTKFHGRRIMEIEGLRRVQGGAPYWAKVVFHYMLTRSYADYNLTTAAVSAVHGVCKPTNITGEHHLAYKGWRATPCWIDVKMPWPNACDLHWSKLRTPKQWFNTRHETWLLVSLCFTDSLNLLMPKKTSNFPDFPKKKPYIPKTCSHDIPT